jgi:hypothetical protein
MAWPPPVLPINRTDATNQQTLHAGDHNAANQALNDIRAHFLGFAVRTRSSPATTDGGGNVNVAFGGAPFPGPPAVVANTADAAMAGQVAVYNITAAGFSMHISTAAGAPFVGTVAVNYIAVYGEVLP